MDEQLNLLSIKEGLPGMHKDLCSHYYSACMTTLHRAGHIVNGTILHLDGNRKGSIPLYWEDYFDETIDRSWKEINYCTDHAAVCMSCVLAIHETEFTIVERSCKGDGFDYWLGRGKGYYDKLLPLLHSYNIGICYNFQVNEKLPVEPFDRRMDEVWTENGILK